VLGSDISLGRDADVTAAVSAGPSRSALSVAADAKGGMDRGSGAANPECVTLSGADTD